ncbi:hypothetical protein [Chryseobacterium camelliae]|uniref:hypothetical protein n=1 Tax=Chryseobacterium camelliae TaxID=1265445 RepID=UPI000C1CA255|nr:hypothetical protein [Chryseobacterium camelliae]
MILLKRITNKIFMLFLIFIIYNIKAQIDERYKNYYFNNTPNAPTTSSFLRYGDIQNNEYTGTNSLGIPLFDVKSGNIKFGLVLQYISGNGIKARDEATSVGLGWDIPLPTITQSVLGYNDLSGIASLKVDLSYNPDGPPFPILNYNQKYYLKKAGYPVPTDFIKQPEKGKYSYFWSQDIILPINGIFKDINNNINYDTSPDVFTLNLFGEKILFIDENYETSQYGASHNFNFKTLDNKGYKITYINDIFKIIAPNGNTYEFADKEEIGIFSMEKDQRNYHLTKITDINNNIIQLEYEHYDVDILPPTSRNLNYTYNYTQTIGGNGSNIPTNDGWGADGQYDYMTPGSPPPYFGTTVVNLYEVPSLIIKSKIYNQSLIKTITGNFGRIVFNYSNRLDYPTKKLDNIVLKNYSESTVRNIIFDYDYFTSLSNSNDPTLNDFDNNRKYKRLKLNSLILNGNDEKYLFEYNTIELPSKVSNSTDYWGLYNGGNTNKTLYPNPNDFNISINIPITDLNNNKKNADILFAKAGILEKVIYPTKGYSIFDYELNTANNLFFPTNWTSKLNVGGGLRLKSQFDYNSNNNKVNETDFLYEGGISMNPLSLIKNATYTTYESMPSLGGCKGGIKSYSVVTMKGANDNTASSLSSGDILGYSKVTKIIKNVLDQTSYKIETYYSNNPDKYYLFYEEQLPVVMPSIKANGTDNGNILSQYTYNSSNLKIKETINSYNTVYSNIYYGTSFQKTSRYLNYCTVDGGRMNVPISIIGQFSIFSKESLLSSSTIIDYINGQELQTVITNYYNDNNLLSQKSTLTPASTQISESFSYSSLIPRLSQANILSENTEKRVYKNGRQILYQTTNYNDTSHYNPTSILTYDLLNNNNSYTEVTYDKYDSKGNLQQYTTKDGISTVIIWGYDHTHPIAKIEGAQLSGISQSLIDTIVNASNTDAQNGTETSEQNLISALDTFRSDASLSGYQISTYTYDPLIGVRSITPPSGIREYYRYDAANRLEKVIDSDKKVLKEFKYNYKN